MPKIENKYKINNTFDNTLKDIFSKKKQEKIIIENKNNSILEEFFK